MSVYLETAKQHLRIDGNEDDELVSLYLQAAREHAALFLNRSVYEDAAALADGVLAGDMTGIVATGAIDAAVLLICGTLYANRENAVIGASVATLPGGSQALLQPYRILTGV